IPTFFPINPDIKLNIKLVISFLFRSQGTGVRYQGMIPINVSGSKNARGFLTLNHFYPFFPNPQFRDILVKLLNFDIYVNTTW
ncbi:MAG: hypothetical protein ACFNJN_07575, partial [Capnocytophaga ochracea]